MAQHIKNGLIYILAGFYILIISAFLTVAVWQTVRLGGLYQATVSPPPAGRLTSGQQLSLNFPNQLLLMLVLAGLIIILVFKRPRRLLPLSIGVILITVGLNLFSGQHIIPQFLIWPTPVTLSEQYIQALAADDLEMALELTDGSKSCETRTQAVFQDHQALLRQKFGDSSLGTAVRNITVSPVATFYEQPIPDGLNIPRPIPHEQVTISAELENGQTLWVTLTTSYNSFLGKRYICGQDRY